MFDRICDHQPSMLEAAAAGRETDPATAEHLAACPTCREAIEAVCWMRKMADTNAESRPLPDPDVIWWKAQLLRRWEAERRAVAPIERMHKAELYAGLACLAGFVIWQWSGLTRVVSSVFDPSSLAMWSAQSAASGAATDTTGLMLLAASLIVGAMILAGVHRMLTE
jgi:predicted anti-sigma-YlaC factor YlaD